MEVPTFAAGHSIIWDLIVSSAIKSSEFLCINGHNIQKAPSITKDDVSTFISTGYKYSRGWAGGCSVLGQ